MHAIQVQIMEYNRRSQEQTVQEILNGQPEADNYQQPDGITGAQFMRNATSTHAKWWLG